MSPATVNRLSVSHAGHYEKNEKGAHIPFRVGLPEYGYLAVLIAAAAGSAGMLAWQTISPSPSSFAGLVIDRLSGLLTFLVAMVGAVTYRFSLRYLDGEPGQAAFLRRLFLTVAAAYFLMLATNLWLLFLSWLMVSLGLHQLLIYYKDRPKAVRPARKKFLISRFGDVALLSAICWIGIHWGTWDVQTFLALSSHESGTAVETVGLLIVAAALTKSAQFPFHSWLPETMESPTPVSALMHAGIINAGGALLLRFSPLLVRDSAALFLLTLVGTATVCLGLLAMWAQTNFKRTLAWSTVGQMGFMMVECGMGAFGAAALHIVGHGFYKAWSFLRAGQLPAPVAPVVSMKPVATLGWLAFGTAAGLASAACAVHLAGSNLTAVPGEFGLVLILALSMGQVWVACFRAAPSGQRGYLCTLLTALAATVLISFGGIALYTATNVFFIPIFGTASAAAGPLVWASAIMPAIALALLCVLHSLLPLWMRTRSGRAFQVHALYGFYFGAVADQWVEWVWDRWGRRTQGANK